MAFGDAISKLKWTRTYLAELVFNMNNPSEFFCENTGAHSWANSSENLKRAKHMDIKIHFVNSIVDNVHATLRHMNSVNCKADGFTETLDIKKFEEFLNMIWV